MGAYLLDHTPKRDQFRTVRRARPTGCIVVHTAETAADFTPPDSAAENVAAFIVRRDTAGSYHDLADADSIIHLVPYEFEAYGDATGSNRWATHVSGAVQAGKWSTYPAAHRDAVARNMARAAAKQARWVKTEYGITVPAKRITKAQSDAGQPGFISHAERDPATRTDPGATFPWDLFLRTYAALMAGNPATTTTPEEFLMSLTDKQQERILAASERILATHRLRWWVAQPDGSLRVYEGAEPPEGATKAYVLDTIDGHTLKTGQIQPAALAAAVKAEGLDVDTDQLAAALAKAITNLAHTQEA